MWLVTATIRTDCTWPMRYPGIPLTVRQMMISTDTGLVKLNVEVLVGYDLETKSNVK